jgi:lipocalin/uncharacterized protein YbjT (DUF2867 family)/ligand-binding SRPBCC domain-containing protein
MMKLIDVVADTADRFAIQGGVEFKWQGDAEQMHEGPILLTGATGYIGGRLLRALEEGGRALRCLARQPERVAAGRATTEVVAGDCLDEASLVAAMDGVDQAYYLVHSMASGAAFATRDRQAAANFGHAARRAGVRRIIYLGGLADDADSLSSHLKSRVETGEALRDSGVPVVEFRASVVIGAGSLSFEMIRALVERLPAMICPRWVDTRTQPIAIDDVLAYLRAALNLPEGREGVFEIGGPDVVSYGDMMREYAKLRGLRRVLIPVPVLTPRLSGLWLGLVTPAQARVGRALVEGLRNSTVVRSSAAIETFAIHPMTLREAFVRAIEEGGAAQFKTDSRLAVVDAPPAQAFAPIRRIGGATGWYFADALWRLRGWIDGGLGGVAMPRTRRDPDDCVVGDVIDGWRVEAYEPDHLLRLCAGLKLPGRGWLEFRVDSLDGGARSLIRQTATFDPRGVAGRLYWYGVLPLHALVFRGLLRRLARRAVRDNAPGDWSTFTHSSIIGAPATEVFRWHEQPGALAALTPATLVRIEQQKGSIRDGGLVTVSIGLGAARVRWAMRHHGYIAGRRFCDEQVAGPFTVWRHAHLFERIGAAQTLYEDRIEFAVARRGALNRLAAAVLRPLLTIAFAHRHRVVRAAVGRARPRSVPRWAAAVAIAAATMLQPAVAQVQTPVRTVPFVDLDRYAGDWFEIARFPNRFQRQCVGDVRATYARRSDGRLDVVNRCRTAEGDTEARGVARIVDERTFATLKVRFAPGWLSWLPMVWGDYWIVGLAPDYSWAVVGDPGREYLWILARAPHLDDESTAVARAAARDNGFDVERLVPTSQAGAGRP